MFAVHGETFDGFVAVDDFDLVEIDECRTVPEMVTLGSQFLKLCI